MPTVLTAFARLATRHPRVKNQHPGSHEPMVHALVHFSIRSSNEFAPVIREWSTVLALRHLQTHVKVARDRSERLAQRCLTQHAARIGGYELPSYVLEALGQPSECSGFDGGAVVQPPEDVLSECHRDASGSEIELSLGWLSSIASSTGSLCAPIKPAIMDTAAATTRHKGSASALPPFTLQPTSIAYGWPVPMKSSMPRHHWPSVTVLVLPAVRRLLHRMNKGGRSESNKDAFSHPLSSEL